MKANGKLVLILLVLLFFSCLSISAASETAGIDADNSQDSFETGDCQLTEESQVVTGNNPELTKVTEKSSDKKAGEVSVNGYEELANQIKSIQQTTQKNHVINLKPGNYTATETITLRQNNGTAYNLTINGNNIILDGLNRYQFIKVERCNLELRNVTLKNFYSINNGGAINLYQSNCSIINSALTNGAAEYQGGAIYAYYSNYCISDSSLVNNTADKGGAIYAYYSNDTVIGTSFINNTAGEGGAIYAGNSNNNVTGSRLTLNTAEFSGGAIKSSYSKNIIADTVLANNGGDVGSAVWITDSNNVIDNITLTDNTAQSRGSIYIYRSNTSVLNSEMADNTAEFGGALFISNSNVEISDTALVSNTANDLGGALCTYNSKLAITNTALSNNTANVWGGAVFAYNSTINITGRTLSDNRAELGGAIYINNSNLSIVGTTLSNNTANDSGGAIFAADSKSDIADSTLSGNTAKNMGGAICYKSSELNLINTTFNNNRAKEGNDTYNYMMVTSIVFNTIAPKEYGDTLTVSGFIKANNRTISGKSMQVDVFINGMKRSLVTNDKGRFSTAVKLNATGIWEIMATFNGQDDYLPCNASTSCNVSKRNTVLKMNVSDLFLNREAILTGNLTDKTNTKLRNANIYVTVNGMTYHMLTDEYGRYTLNYTPTVRGTNNLTVLYKGNKNYASASITASFEVDEDIIIRATCYRDNITVTALLTQENEVLKNRKVNLTINGETTVVKTDDEGILYYTCISKSAGNNTLEITYNDLKWTRNFTTDKRNTTLTVSAPETALINKTVCISGNLNDQTNTKLKNANVYIKIAGKQYHVITDSSGAYSLDYTPAKKGTYNITVTYKGNSNYNPTTFVKTITVS